MSDTTGVETVLVTTKPCPFCNRESTLHVPIDGFRAWRAGALIQNALPDMSLAQREQLISGTHALCFERAFGG